MSVLVVAALEVTRTGRTRFIVATCAGRGRGHLDTAAVRDRLLATGIVLSAVRDARRAVAVGLCISVAADHRVVRPALRSTSAPCCRSTMASRSGSRGLLTAPIDQTLLPASIWIDGTALVAGVVWLPLVLLAIVVIASSPFIRERVASVRPLLRNRRHRRRPLDRAGVPHPPIPQLPPRSAVRPRLDGCRLDPRAITTRQAALRTSSASSWSSSSPSGLPPSHPTSSASRVKRIAT